MVQWDRQQHGLLRLYAAYVRSLSKMPRTNRRRSKKDPRPVRSRLGPNQSRTGNWSGSNSSQRSRSQSSKPYWRRSSDRHELCTLLTALRLVIIMFIICASWSSLIHLQPDLNTSWHRWNGGCRKVRARLFIRSAWKTAGSWRVSPL